MGVVRDYNGIRKTRKKGHSYVFVKADSGRIIDSCIELPTDVIFSKDIVVMSLEEYRWFTAFEEKDKKEKKILTLMEWYERTDFSKLLAICNLCC